jgi:predicted ribosomally synthesized peptide with nif11-like leader
MSTESAKAFVDRLKTDEHFSKKISECKNAEEVMEYAKQAGFDFTQEEMGIIRGTLSDEDLEQVAGGSGSCSVPGTLMGMCTDPRVMLM